MAFCRDSCRLASCPMRCCCRALPSRPCHTSPLPRRVPVAPIQAQVTPASSQALSGSSPAMVINQQRRPVSSQISHALGVPVGFLANPHREQ